MTTTATTTTKLSAGKAHSRSMADATKSREKGRRDPRASGREADRRGKRARKSGEDRGENCVARGSQSGESTTNARRQTRSGRRNTRATGTRKFRYRRNGIDKRMRETFELKKNNKRRKDIKEEYAKNEQSFISAELNFLSNDIKNCTRAGMSFNFGLQMCEILPLCHFRGETGV